MLKQSHHHRNSMNPRLKNPELTLQNSLKSIELHHMQIQNQLCLLQNQKPKTNRNSTSIRQRRDNLQVTAQDGSPSTMSSKETNPVYHRAEGDNTRPNKFTKLRKHIEKIKQHLKTKDKGINIHDADKVAYTSYLTPSKNTKVSSSRYNDTIWGYGSDPWHPLEHRLLHKSPYTCNNSNKRNHGI